MSITIDKITDENKLFALHIGDSGSGKSSAAACYPKPIYWFDIDKRIRGARRFLYDLGVLDKWGKEIRVEQYDLKKGFEAIDKELDMLVNSQRVQYKTIVFDGLSSTSELLIDDAFTVIGKLQGQQAEKLSGHKKFGVVDLPGWDEFGYEQKAFRDIMLALKSLQCNVVVTAHWVDTYDTKGVIIGKRINLRNRISSGMMKWFDEVYYFEKKFEKVGSAGKIVEQTTHTVSFTNDLARTTFPGLPIQADWTKQDFFEILRKGGVKHVAETAGESVPGQSQSAG